MKQNNADSIVMEEAEKPWQYFGFRYDGSLEDFRRLNEGKAPIAYERWITEGGTIQVNTVINNDPNLTISLVRATYIPQDQGDRYIREQYKGSDYSFERAALEFTASTAVGRLVDRLARISAGFTWTAIAAEGFWSLILADERIQKERQEGIIDAGSGLLILEFEYRGNRAIGISRNQYYAWDGTGNLSIMSRD